MRHTGPRAKAWVNVIIQAEASVSLFSSSSTSSEEEDFNEDEEVVVAVYMYTMSTQSEGLGRRSDVLAGRHLQDQLALDPPRVQPPEPFLDPLAGGSLRTSTRPRSEQNSLSG